MKTALLLSGGMDSIALAYWKKPDLAITIDYGQRAAKAEIYASSKICKKLNICHRIISIDCKDLGSGDMSTTKAIDLAPTSDWWPYRNQLLITLSAMQCIANNINTILIGTVASDSSHIDGTKAFISKINALIFMQEGNIKVDAPAIEMTTLELIKNTNTITPVSDWAHSCHKSNYICGRCRGCNKYFETLEQLK